MTINEFSRLERYRRIADYHALDTPQDEVLPADEIDFIRSQLNAKVFLHAKPWMLPSWAILSLRDLKGEQNTISEFRNNMYRNWSLIGGVAAKHYGIADSRGLASAKPELGSIDFWLLDGEDLIFPALMRKDEPQLKLVSSDDQVYEWKKHIGPVEFNRLVYHVKKGKSEYIYNEIALRNHGLESAEFTFYLLVRPLSVLGVEPIEILEFEPDVQTVHVNGTTGLVLDTRPTSLIFCEADDDALIEKMRSGIGDEGFRYASSAGLATMAIRYDVKLSPAGSQQIFFYSPLSLPIESENIARIQPTSHDRDESIGEWFALADQRASVSFPNEELDSVFSQAVASLALQASPAMFPEDPYLALLPWKERMRILLALLKSGAIGVAEGVVDTLMMKLRIPENHIDLSLYGPLLWGLVQFYEYTQCSTLNETRLGFLRDLVAKVTEAVKIQFDSKSSSSSGDTTTQEEELLQHYPIIQPGTIANLDNMFWNLASMKSVVNIISPFHDDKLMTSLKDTIRQYEDQIHVACSEIQNARWLRPTDTLYEQVENEILNLLTTIAALQRFGWNLPLFEQLYEKISSRRIVNKLWKQFQNTDQFSSHLALRVALYFVLTRQRDKVEPLLRRALEFLTDDYHLPEFVNPQSYGGAAGAGLSAMASADLILLLSDMLVCETDKALVLLPGIPEEWFTSKKPLIIDGLPLTRGETHIEIGMSANQYQIEISMDDLPAEIEVHVPSSVPMSMVRAYGGSIVERASKAASPFLKVVPLSNQVVLTYPK